MTDNGANDTQIAAGKIPILTFQLDGQTFALPVRDVVQIVEMVTMTHLPQLPPSVRGVIDYRGRFVAVIDLRLHFALPFRPYGLSTPIILINFKEEILGLVVDSVQEVHTIFETEIDPGPAMISLELSGMDDFLTPGSYVAGAVKVDRRILLILQIEKLLTQQEQLRLLAAMISHGSKEVAL